MASLLPAYGNAITGGNFTCIFSSINVPTTYSWVEEWSTTPNLLTSVNKRGNFWSRDVILDGGFPQLYWQHSLKMYTEATTSSTPFVELMNFFRIFTQVSTAIHGTAQLLTINDGDTANVRINFGQCYLENFSLEEPSGFSLYRGGRMVLEFCGTSIPSVVF